MSAAWCTSPAFALDVSSSPKESTDPLRQRLLHLWSALTSLDVAPGPSSADAFVALIWRIGIAVLDSAAQIRKQQKAADDDENDRKVHGRPRLLRRLAHASAEVASELSWEEQATLRAHFLLGEECSVGEVILSAGLVSWIRTNENSLPQPCKVLTSMCTAASAVVAAFLLSVSESDWDGVALFLFPSESYKALVAQFELILPQYIVANVRDKILMLSRESTVLARYLTSGVWNSMQIVSTARFYPAGRLLQLKWTDKLKKINEHNRKRPAAAQDE